MDTNILERIHSLDLLRLTAYAMIFIYHFMLNAEVNEIYTFKFFSYENENMHIATLGVALFFMISGAAAMLSAQEKFNIKKFYTKKIRTIMVPFYMVYVSVVLCQFLEHRRIWLNGTLPHWRFIFTLLGIDGYLYNAGIETFYAGVGEWFLGCLLMMYLVFPLIHYLLLKKQTLEVNLCFFPCTAFAVILCFLYISASEIHPFW